MTAVLPMFAIGPTTYIGQIWILPNLSAIMPIPNICWYIYLQFTCNCTHLIPLIFQSTVPKSPALSFPSWVFLYLCIWVHDREFKQCWCEDNKVSSDCLPEGQEGNKCKLLLTPKIKIMPTHVSKVLNTHGRYWGCWYHTCLCWVVIGHQMLIFCETLC